MAKKDKILTDKAVSIFRKKGVIISLALLFLMLVITVAIITVYGINTGNYTAGVSDELSKVGITLSKNNDGSDSTNEMTGTLRGNIVPICEYNVNKYNVINNDGEYRSVDGNYIGYTYYLFNNGSINISIESSLKILNATHNIEKAARVWTFYSVGDDVDTEGTIFKSHEEVSDGTYETGDLYKNYKGTTDFEQDDIVETKVFKDIKPGEKIKISIIVWVEAKDPDCTDYGDNSIKGGVIKLGMSFTAYEEKII